MKLLTKHIRAYNYFLLSWLIEQMRKLRKDVYITFNAVCLRNKSFALTITTVIQNTTKKPAASITQHEPTLKAFTKVEHANTITPTQNHP